MHAWLQEHVGRVSAASDLAKAIRYALRHWPGLIAYLDDGRIEMDTNIVERDIRPIAVTRKNAFRGQRRRCPTLGHCHDIDPDSQAERRRADGIPDRCA